MNDISQPLPSAEPVEQALHEIRKKIYPRAVTGNFATARWAFVWLTQLIYYGLPWLTWNDRQAVLFDLAGATAWTAASACRCARPASTSATACSTSASAAERAWTAATR